MLSISFLHATGLLNKLLRSRDRARENEAGPDDCGSASGDSGIRSPETCVSARVTGGEAGWDAMKRWGILR